MKNAKTLCLVMIVRNEEKVIERCLNRVKDHIDYWVIVDTGSDDKTPDLIQKNVI
ncbi:glycosyltransferase [Actinobacillus minor]|uniref:glycosyltransferase n=1 Tax=Actinobacillus minor TaxID=51047 RepID=UPI0023F4C337|nr:glycosyltransferase [Actinobacillus minor]MDD6910576.1 glycosyltransferase [Actinobacillus minor]MDY4713001.1 glycosyltransferase [Actinobacillus minor]